MKIERSFTLPLNETVVRQRLAAYFAAAGYRQTAAKGLTLSFQRGSRAGSWIAINPSQLFTLAEIEIKPKESQVQVKAEFEVKSVIRDDTHFTEEFWESEMRELETALFKAQYFPLKAKHLNLKNLYAIVRSLAVPMVFFLIFAAFSLLISFIIFRSPGFSGDFPEMVALVSMLVAGVGTYLLYRYWRRRRQRFEK